jgi:hypothetical protein
MKIDYDTVSEEGLELAENMGIDTYDLDEEDRFNLYMMSYHKKLMEYYEEKLKGFQT